jgi:hypothetical protein
MNSIEINAWQKNPSIAAIVKATFPDYRRKKVWLRAADTITFYDLNWSGGTRSEYRACTTDGQSAGSMAKYHTYAPWDARQVEGQSVPIPAGMIVVRGGDFCGKQATLCFHVNPADMPKYLAAISAK